MPVASDPIEIHLIDPEAATQAEWMPYHAYRRQRAARQEAVPIGEQYLDGRDRLAARTHEVVQTGEERPPNAATPVLLQHAAEHVHKGWIFFAAGRAGATHGEDPACRSPVLPN